MQIKDCQGSIPAANGSDQVSIEERDDTMLNSVIGCTALPITHFGLKQSHSQGGRLTRVQIHSRQARASEEYDDCEEVSGGQAWQEWKSPSPLSADFYLRDSLPKA